MMGASEGRRFNDVSRYGVSVFDFVLPRSENAETGSEHARFVGYGPVPGFNKSEGKVKNGKAAP